MMMCNMVENNQEACYPYWPSKDGETVKYGKVVVTMLSSTSYDDFSVRNFSLQENKVLKHCLYVVLLINWGERE